MTKPHAPSGFDAIDHVVVLMMENRSFDNVLGYLYPEGVPADAPLSRCFEGLLEPDGTAKPLSNPVPATARHRPPPGVERIAAEPVPPGAFDSPYPDPGEEFPHINTQLFGNAEGQGSPKMDGFVADYIRNFRATMNGRDPTYDDYRQIMRSYTPAHLPVLSTLAREFAVFDHWFAAVPSQTFCNRAFWHAGTSWGRVTNEPYPVWLRGSAAPTIFNQLSATNDPQLTWKVYSGNFAFYTLTALLHTDALKSFANDPAHFAGMDAFHADCAAGRLPAYSFDEPRFEDPHNDWHPASPSGNVDGPNPPTAMELGELFVWQVYEAIRTSATSRGSNAMNTLLIITCDEHGGCYDHVPPPRAIPPEMGDTPLQDGFDYTRLGLRVPMVMVSAHIAANTIVSTPLDHCSFMNTMRAKWEDHAPGAFPPLTARVAAAAKFTEVFTARYPRPASEWPVIIPPAVPDPEALLPLTKTTPNHLQKSIADAHAHLRAQGHSAVAGKAIPGGSSPDLGRLGAKVPRFDDLV